MEHTPGPWTSGGCVVYGPDGSGVADLVAGTCNHNSRIPDETEANARLIAAAPELLSALEKALQWIDAVISEPDKALISRDLGNRIEEEAHAAIKAAKKGD